MFPSAHYEICRKADVLVTLKSSLHHCWHGYIDHKYPIGTTFDNYFHSLENVTTILFYYVRTTISVSMSVNMYVKLLTKDMI